MRIVETRDLELVRALDRRCLPDDEPYAYATAKWWVASAPEANPSVVAYGGAKMLSTLSDAVYLCRAGVLPCARGQGLQRRLIRARVKWAKSIGAKRVLTYTSADNVHSANSLIAEGFRLWTPASPWAPGALHWVKRLS